MQQEKIGREARGVAGWLCSRDATPRDLRNGMIMNVWLAVWMAIWLVALWYVSFIDDANSVLAAGAMVVVALAAIPAIRATVRFVREADELTRHMQVRAMAIAFGAGFVMFTLFPFLETVVTHSALPEAILDFTTPVMVMIWSYVVAVLVQQRQYG